jgi:thiol-disulfide isomerase/thioredoxin
MFERILITAGLILLGLGAFLLFRYLHMRNASKATVAEGKPAVIYFRSDACAPCATQGRFLQQLLAEFGDRIVVEKVDAVHELEKAERYGVFTLPTTLIVDAAGQIRHANYGLADARKLANQLRAVEAVLAS